KVRDPEVCSRNARVVAPNTANTSLRGETPGVPALAGRMVQRVTMETGGPKVGTDRGSRGVGADAFFEAPPGPVDRQSPPEMKVEFFGQSFAARSDIYAVRESVCTGRAGWLPAVRGG